MGGGAVAEILHRVRPAVILTEMNRSSRNGMPHTPFAARKGWHAVTRRSRGSACRIAPRHADPLLRNVTACHPRRVPTTSAWILAAILLAPSVAAVGAESLQIAVRLDAQAAAQPVTGRVFVFCSQRPGEPRMGPDWFNPEPFFGLDVVKLKPGDRCTLDDRACGFPGPLSRLPPGKYRVQAVLDRSLDSPQPGQAVGNLYGDVQEVRLDATSSVELVLQHVIPSQPFRELENYREVSLRSRKLSAFHGRDVIEHAAVILPPSYQTDAQKRFPVIYVIPGFGGSHRSPQWLWITGPPQADPGQAEFIRVMLSGQCRWGDHEYADSATNGPCGDALVHEMIPYIDEHYRTLPVSTARFVTGHSSGGWSSLWLQVTYPEVFGGVWSLAPDPVDFHDFQQIDLYAKPPLSVFRDPQGQRRPIARIGPTPAVWYEDFSRMDDCLSRGGQLRSFEAVFSPRGPDGLPRKLWDRTTGQIDPETARAWEKYDIGRTLQTQWKTLGPKLQGKLHVAVGDLDTFYLDGAVRRLGETLRRLGSDAVVEIVPGRDHSTLLSRDRCMKTRRQIGEQFRKNHPAKAQ